MSDGGMVSTSKVSPLSKLIASAQKHKARTTIIVLFVMAVVYFTAPWFHWLWIGLFYKMMGAWFIGIIGLSNICASFLHRFNKFTEEEKVYKDLSYEQQKEQKKPSLFTVKFALSGLLIFGGMILLWSLQSARAEVVLTERAQAAPISVLPETTEVRYMPIEIAENCAKTALTDSRFELGDLDPIQVDNEIDWVAPRTPNGLWNTWFGNTDGVAVIKPDCTLRNDKKYQQPMHYGEGMLLTDQLEKQLIHREYAADVPEIYYITNGEELLGVAPYIRYQLDWWSMARVPKWGGVMIIHTDGRIEDLSVKQAQKDPRLAGQRIYPEQLAKQIGQAWSYKHGIWNKWFTHKDETVVPTIDNSENQMPYLIPSKNGPQ